MKILMKHVNNYLPVIVAVWGVVMLVFFSATVKIWVWFLLVVGAIAWYCWIIAKKIRRSDYNFDYDSDIDSVYYFGFIITIVTLVCTILRIADDNNLSEHDTQVRVIVQFGIGLAFTAIALICRMILLILQGEIKKADAADRAAERFADTIEQAASNFDNLSLKISNLSSNAQRRSDSLLATFDAIENQFKERLENTSKTIGNATEQFSDAINALVKNTQARELKLEQAFNEATLTFNTNLDQTSKHSLDKTSAAIDQSTQQFTRAIVRLSADVERLQQDMKTLNFDNAAKRIEAFARAVETSLGSTQSSVDNANQNAVAAINILTAAAQDTHALALRIAENLDSLKNLDQLVAKINQAGTGLDELSRRAVQSGGSLDGLGSAAHTAASASGQLARNSDAASASLVQVADTAKGIHALADTISDSLKVLKAAEPSKLGTKTQPFSPVYPMPVAPAPKPKPWQQKTLGELWRDWHGKNNKA